MLIFDVISNSFDMGIMFINLNDFNQAKMQNLCAENQFLPFSTNISQSY